jgi:hypothetical protein
MQPTDRRCKREGKYFSQPAREHWKRTVTFVGQSDGAYSAYKRG